MKVLVCGGRDFTDTRFIHTELDRLHAKFGFSVVIEGDGRGVDRIAGDWARIRGLELIEFPADWTTGRRAGPIRNERMLREGKPDRVIAFPGGRGTEHTCSLAEKLRIPVERVERPRSAQQALSTK